MPAKVIAKPPSSAARDRILKTAHDLFYQEGIRATGIDRVIAEAGVTKVTFYRHFPSKNDLVLAFLEYRHERWMHWFDKALKRNASVNRTVGQVVIATMSEWFRQRDFRGCAFINTVIELGGDVPDTVAISREHKEAMTKAIMEVMTPSPDCEADATAITMAIDGAVVRAQYEDPDDALASLQRLLQPFM